MVRGDQKLVYVFSTFDVTKTNCDVATAIEGPPTSRSKVHACAQLIAMHNSAYIESTLCRVKGYARLHIFKSI